MKEKSFEIVFFDVGLGDCTIILSDGYVMLIDGGSWCCDALCLFLKEKRIDFIDYVICTHAHGDHVNGLSQLLSKILFGTLFTNILSFPKSQEFENLIARAKAINAKIIIPDDKKIYVLEKDELRFLSPGDNDKFISGNDRSLTCILSHENKKFFFAADAGKNVFDELLQSNIDIRADVLKIPHHGLYDLGNEVLTAISPKYAIISYGANHYGKLSDELLDHLEKRNVETLITQKCGDIECRVADGVIDVKEKEYGKALVGKKLLFLAANAETIKFVNVAKALGIKTIVLDHITDSPAKSIADEYYDIDGKAVDEIVNIVNKNEIDGVLVGVADPLVPAYLEIAKKLKYPCYLSDENIDFFTDKGEFKRLCKTFGLSIVKEFYRSDNLIQIDISHISFPCIVKPTKGRGGKGVFLCKDENSFGECFTMAKNCSDNGQVIVEQYMECKDIVVNYLFKNGIAYLIGVSDRNTLTSVATISPVTYSNVYPSELTELYMEKCHAKFVKLFESLHIQNGILEMQVFWDGLNFYPYDPACILGGELSGPIFREIYGLDLVRAFIIFSLTGNLQTDIIPLGNGMPIEKRCGQSIWILLKPGKITMVRGINEVREMGNVLECIQRLKVGDVVSKGMFQTEKSSLARVWISADSKEELQRLEKKIRGKIVALDEQGKSMIWEGMK